jgi:ATP-dependent helicase Lhr and Lhr-like helicase
MQEFGFHPLIQQWFAGRFGGPTEPQRRGWPVIAGGGHTLIAAPTGSGKTLTAFLAVIDRLLRESVQEGLPDEIRVVYVSPLRALSNDMHRNLQGPLDELTRLAEEIGAPPPGIRVGLRTGDTPAKDRAAIVRRPPQILVTTPESLYLMLTSPRAREALAAVDTVIVDEIHALVRDKRGSHLALSLERLAALSSRPIQRIGLSATQKPLDRVARFLTGVTDEPCTIVDVGHQRQLDLAVDVPMEDLGAVCTHEQWAVVYARMAELIQSHHSTLIFVNTRRMAERLTHQLSELLGEEHVSSHHGSLSSDIRLSTERRLKSGDLKAVVATASLELGIDVGYIDLVIQLGSPRSIATFLQRIGRSGHSLHAIPKGRLMPLSRDELIECLALLRAVKHGVLDAVRIPVAPLDVLAQQIVAEAVCGECDVEDLFERFRRADPYRELTRERFEGALTFLSDGLTDRSGRGGSLLYYDRVNGRIKARPIARSLAVGNAGAIPELGSYRVVAMPENTVIGSVDEDFAVESQRGDIFLLGNTSWRIEHVRQGDVVVSDAHGAPPSIPFWFGEAPGRTLELSEQVSQLRDELTTRCEDPTAAIDWLISETGCPDQPAGVVVEYIRSERAALGIVPTQRQIVFERFFDETGGMQLVVHAPFGAPITRAWGYAMRKRFCRSFDFELQATADDDGFILSVGPQHSFPIESLFPMLTSHNVRNLLEQAVLVQPPFQLRWRWNVTRALLVQRTKFGQKVPPALQRFRADDLLTAVFPSLTGCQENHTGDIEIPDHPLVQQTMHDCLHEAMDIDGLVDVLRRIEDGEIQLVARDTREPSPFCYELLNAYPYAFLDGGEIQERRARTVSPGSDLSTDGPPLDWLDPAAIGQVVAEALPLVRSADELHDLLLTVGVLPTTVSPNGTVPRPEPTSEWPAWFAELVASRRACEITLVDGRRAWIAVERAPAVQALQPVMLPEGFAVPEALRKEWDSVAARLLVARGWMEFCGPVTAAELAAHLGWTTSQTESVLEALEGEGAVLRGRYRQRDDAPLDWCHRRLLARIHRLTLAGLRKQIEPVDVAAFQRFLFAHHGIWNQHRTDSGPLAPVFGGEGRGEGASASQGSPTAALSESTRPDALGPLTLALPPAAGERGQSPVAPAGANGVYDVVAQLQGIDVPAVCWERDVLPARLREYQSAWLDELCLTGEVGWGRLDPPTLSPDRTPGGNLTRVAPLSLFLRGDLGWLLPSTKDGDVAPLSSQAQEILELLQREGASFAADLMQQTRMLPTHLEEALGELISRGLVTADSFAGLRSLIADKTDLIGRPTRRHTPGLSRRRMLGTVSGRWSIRRRQHDGTALTDTERLQAWCWQLVRRWGVVFRDLLTRDDASPRWWELVPIFRRMEARGELRGGRFIVGVAGEQFALESTIHDLRKHREPEGSPSYVVVNAADPLNLVGIITDPPRIPSLASNRIVYRDGVAVAALQGGEVVWLASRPAAEQRIITALLHGHDPSELPDVHSPRRRNGRKPAREEYPKQIPRPLIR